MSTRNHRGDDTPHLWPGGIWRLYFFMIAAKFLSMLTIIPNYPYAEVMLHNT